MKLKDRVEELEKRVKELEARPIYWPMYVPYFAPQPTPFYPWYGQPNTTPPYVITWVAGAAPANGTAAVPAYQGLPQNFS